MFKHVTNNNSHRFMDDDYDTFSAVCVICSSQTWHYILVTCFGMWTFCFVILGDFFKLWTCSNMLHDIQRSIIQNFKTTYFFIYIVLIHEFFILIFKQTYSILHVQHVNLLIAHDRFCREFIPLISFLWSHYKFVITHKSC